MIFRRNKTDDRQPYLDAPLSRLRLILRLRRAVGDVKAGLDRRSGAQNTAVRAFLGRFFRATYWWAGC